MVVVTSEASTGCSSCRLPPKPKALKTLEEEGVLNGYVANKYDAHYKNQGVTDGIAE